jgi:hypothetical protein
MAIETQLSIFLENRPGRLAELCRALADAQVNIRAFSVHEQADTSVVRLLPSSADKARKVLRGLDLAFSEADVLSVKMPNRPGALEQVARQLAEAGINIEYGYGTAGRQGAKGDCVFRVSNIEEARRAVGG